MAKHKIAYAISAAALIAGSGIFAHGVWADEASTVLGSCDGVEDCAVVTSTAELKTAIDGKKANIVVGSSFDLTADLRLGADTNLYLENNTITSDGWSLINSSAGALTIYGGENGKFVETGGEYAPLYIHGEATLESGTIEAAGLALYVLDEGSNFTMNGGTIKGGGSAVIIDDSAKFTLNNGLITSDGWTLSAYDNTEFIMNGGTVANTKVGGIAITGNGTTDPEKDNYGANAKITINDGLVESKEVGVYVPQMDGVTTINGGTINADYTGVEVRAGALNINGGAINVNSSTPYKVIPNGNGNTTDGAAVAVSQHTTKLPISVNITNGSFVAPVVFSEANPQKNSAEDIAKISLSITGGTFIGDVVSEDFDREDFVTGGNFGKVASAEEGNINVEIDGAVVAKAQTVLATSEVDVSTLSLKADEPEATVVLARDFALVDEDGGAVTVERGDEVNLTIHVALSGEEYEALIGYDKVQAIYFDEDGAEVERIDATLQQREDGLWEVVFTTDHLSTYAIAGVNNTENEETSGGAAATDAAAAPDTGTVTVAGASAMSAAIITAVAVGLLTSIISFAYLIRKH